MAEVIKGVSDNTLVYEIIADLTTELSISDDNFDSVLLATKVRSAYREVREARKYPMSYSEERILRDMNNYYSTIRNLSLYDYWHIGYEGERSHSDSGVSRTYYNRASYFVGVCPLSNH